MGFQDRDYYRERSQPTAVTSVVIKLIIINCVVFLADVFFGGGNQHQITRLLMLHGDAVVHPWKWYQFLTAGFVHSPELLHIAGNMFGLYVFGRPLEERFGRREFLRFYLAAIVLGNVVWGLRNYFLVGPTGACLGASGGVTATIILFCLLNPRATLLLFFAIPMPAWLFGVLVVASDVLGPRLPESRVAYDVHLVGAAFAAAYWHFGWNLGRVPGVAALGRLAAAPRKWLKPRPSLKVHDAEQSYEDLDAQADRLLAKVNREGLGSLTAEERHILEAYSRRTRQKLR
jgi:membrane associated rhomboid family serine protease